MEGLHREAAVQVVLLGHTTEHHLRDAHHLEGEGERVGVGCDGVGGEGGNEETVV